MPVLKFNMGIVLYEPDSSKLKPIKI